MHDYGYTLHVGIDPKDLNDLLRITHPLPHDIDGDGWNCWGESVGDDINDDRTLHVTFPLERKRQARLLLGVLAARGIPLVPSTRSMYERHNGLLAVLSDTTDWGALDEVEGLGGVRVWRSVCPDPDCGRDHTADPRCKAEQEPEDEPYTEAPGPWAYHVEVRGTDAATARFWELVREAEESLNVQFNVVDAVPLNN